MLNLKSRTALNDTRNAPPAPDDWFSTPADPVSIPMEVDDQPEQPRDPVPALPPDVHEVAQEPTCPDPKDAIPRPIQSDAVGGRKSVEVDQPVPPALTSNSTHGAPAELEEPILVEEAAPVHSLPPISSLPPVQPAPLVKPPPPSVVRPRPLVTSLYRKTATRSRPPNGGKTDKPKPGPQVIGEDIQRPLQPGASAHAAKKGEKKEKKRAKKAVAAANAVSDPTAHSTDNAETEIYSAEVPIVSSLPTSSVPPIVREQSKEAQPVCISTGMTTADTLAGLTSVSAPAPVVDSTNGTSLSVIEAPVIADPLPQTPPVLEETNPRPETLPDQSDRDPILDLQAGCYSDEVRFLLSSHTTVRR